MRRLGTRRLRWAASGVMVAGLAVGTIGYAASTGAEAATTASQAATGVLNLNASLALITRHGGEPARECDRGPTGDCVGRTIAGGFPGLGQVNGKYAFPLATGPPWCARLQTKSLGYTARLSVAGKGEIHVAVADGAECLDHPAIRTQAQTFTVTGGAGTYLGATGSGTLTRTLGEASDYGTETWTGTLNVSGYEFDTTRPTISGATSKTVKAKKGAKSARVTFKVTAQDGTDGVVPTRCDPQSGSRFQLGRTQVKCAATDSSANTATAAFRITVRATR